MKDSFQVSELPDGSRLFTTLPLSVAQSLCVSVDAKTAHYESVFKDTSKAFVGVLKVDDNLKGLVKIPRSRNHRRWERFLTLFRDGEALRQFSQHLRLKGLGLRGPTPLLAVERRSYGMVVDGFYIYEFINGRSGTQADRDLIATELLKLYELGYRRKDPKPANFVICSDGVYLIDFSLNKPFFFSKIRRAMELSQFSASFSRYQRYGEKLGFSPFVIGSGWRLQKLSQRVRKARRGLVKRMKGRKS